MLLCYPAPATPTRVQILLKNRIKVLLGALMFYKLFCFFDLEEGPTCRGKTRKRLFLRQFSAICTTYSQKITVIFWNSKAGASVWLKPATLLWSSGPYILCLKHNCASLLYDAYMCLKLMLLWFGGDHSARSVDDANWIELFWKR